jgi:hypothetical protein
MYPRSYPGPCIGVNGQTTLPDQLTPVAEVRKAGPRRAADRLVTSIDIAAAATELDTDRQLSISALHQLELVVGRRVTLLDDRG